MEQRRIHLAGGTLGTFRHVCALFSSPSEEYEITLPFIKEGLEAGEKAFHVVDPGLRSDHLRRAEINFSAAERGGQLEVKTWEQTYLRSGRFDQNAMLVLTEEILQGGSSQGFPLTRFVAQMEWARKDCPGILDLVKYEANLNYVLRNRDDVILCIYDLAKFDAQVVIDVMRVHPVVIVGGALQDNPFYVPPGQFLQALEKPG